MTFSIVAWDPDADPSPEWGVAVASKFLAVGSVVPWLAAGAGALATQAFANLHYGPDGLRYLAEGKDASWVVETLTNADEKKATRQLGMVDAHGRAASFTGDDCFDWAGGRVGDGYCCQGNILTGPDVVDDMAEAFGSTDGKLAARLLAALRAGDRAGGDRRGRQSAGVRVVREGGGYGGGTDLTVDLRVDVHPVPVEELHRLYALHLLYFPSPGDMDFIDIDQDLASEMRSLLAARGHRSGGTGGYDQSLKDALFAYVGVENLEERWSDEAKIERAVLEHLRTSKSS